jgi:hypothetical protein
MPFPIILCATVVSISWLLFGISVNNPALIVSTKSYENSSRVECN